MYTAAELISLPGVVTDMTDEINAAKLTAVPLHTDKFAVHISNISKIDQLSLKTERHQFLFTVYNARHSNENCLLHVIFLSHHSEDLLFSMYVTNRTTADKLFTILTVSDSR